eukprot:104576_1
MQAMLTGFAYERPNARRRASEPQIQSNPNTPLFSNLSSSLQSNPNAADTTRSHSANSTPIPNPKIASNVYSISNKKMNSNNNRILNRLAIGQHHHNGRRYRPQSQHQNQHQTTTTNNNKPYQYPSNNGNNYNDINNTPIPEIVSIDTQTNTSRPRPNRNMIIYTTPPIARTDDIKQDNHHSLSQSVDNKSKSKSNKQQTFDHKNLNKNKKKK